MNVNELIDDDESHTTTTTATTDAPAASRDHHADTDTTLEAPDATDTTPAASHGTPTEITGIQFGLRSPEQIRRESAQQVVTMDTYDDTGAPVELGLMDPHLGAVDPGVKCKTCGQHSGGCNGHHGHIELAAPVVHVGHTKTIRALLRGTCSECHHLMLSQDARDTHGDRQARIDFSTDADEDAAAAVTQQAAEHDACPNCGAEQHSIVHEQPASFYEERDTLAMDYADRIATAMAGEDPDGYNDDRYSRMSIDQLASRTGIDTDRLTAYRARELQPTATDRAKLETALDISLTETTLEWLSPETIRERLAGIPDADVELAGLDAEHARPEWTVLTAFPVPPATARPSIKMGDESRSEDDLTHKLRKIIRVNERLKSNADADAPQAIVTDMWKVLQYHATTFMNNSAPGAQPARHRSGRPLKGMKGRLNGKDGRFRKTLSGKRVNYSARTVITPDPTLSINEVGVPEAVAEELTQEMTVTEQNLNRARQYVANGPDTHPGATHIITPDGKRLAITNANDEADADDGADVHANLAETIEPGYTVVRHLIDGDITLFNRQPSLHRMSIMAHEAVIMPGKTFRLNTTVCPPYNADFDGDEMNLHALQDPEARAEARVLMRVQENILSPRFGENIIGAIQDHISGLTLLTQPDRTVSKDTALTLLRDTTVGTDALPAPDGHDDDGEPYWSGATLFGQVVPDSLSTTFTASNGDEVVIENGTLIDGVIDAAAVGAFGGEIVDTITKVYGNTRARDFINDVSSIAIRAIMQFGFSVGIDDESLTANADTHVTDELESARANCADLIDAYEAGELQSLPGKTLDETLEARVMQELADGRDTAGTIANDDLANDNPARVMAESGARGSMLNLTQMSACVGQQAVSGERIHRGLYGRTTAHFKRGDKSPDAHGFVESSYREGLSPTEFFFHAAGGREGLVDTAIRTAKSGYLQRRLQNATNDVRAEYDGTVRNPDGSIVQFEYGEDGTDPAKVSSDHETGADEPAVDVAAIADRILAEEFTALSDAAAPTTTIEDLAADTTDDE